MMDDAERLGLQLWKLLHALFSNQSTAPSSATVQSLISRGADVNYEKDEWTLLRLASRHGQVETVKMLIAAEDIDLDATDYCLGTAFMLACMFGQLEIAKALLAAHKLNSSSSSSFNVNAHDILGNTALMNSCTNCLAEVVGQLLASPNIDAYAKNNDGKTALECAEEGSAREFGVLVTIKALFQGELLLAYQLYTVHSLRSCSNSLSSSATRTISLCSLFALSLLAFQTH
jgi:ankyrin repeat protein